MFCRFVFVVGITSVNDCKRDGFAIRKEVMGMSPETILTVVLVLGMLVPFVLSVFCTNRVVCLFFRVVCVMFLVVSLISVGLSAMHLVFHWFS